MSDAFSCGIDLSGNCVCDDPSGLVETQGSDGVPTMAVECTVDDTPDTDDGMYISMRYLNILLSSTYGSTSVPHCHSCTCTA